MAKQNSRTPKTPFPSAGEIVHFLANVLCMGEFIEDKKEKQTFNKYLRRLSKEKDLDIERFDEMIDQIFINLPSQIQSTPFSKILKESLVEFLSMYKHLVIKMPSAFATRKIILQIISPHFSDFLAMQIQNIKDTYVNIELQFPEDKFWFLPDRQSNSNSDPIEKVLNWWLKVCGLDNLHQLAQLVGAQIDENYIDPLYQKLNLWKSGSIPEWGSIKELVDDQITYNIENEAILKQSFIINFIIARAVQITLNKIQAYLGDDTYDQALELFPLTLKTMENEPQKVFTFFKKSGKIINMEIENYRPKNNQQLINKFFSMANTVTNITTEKKPGDEKIAQQTLEELSKTEPFSRELKFLISWHKGIYYALQYKHKEALKEYEKAFEEGKLRGGYLLKMLIREGITLAAYLKKPAPFSKFYKWALTYDLFSDPYDEVKEWILLDQAKQFANIFPPESYYKSVPPQKIENLKKEKFSWLINIEEWENRKLDLRNPDRFIKGCGPTPLTQLMIYGAFGNIDRVKKLLEAGADPNKIDNNGTTALMHCLIGNSRETALLLLNEDITESINSQTKKKRVTALSLAIDLADVELVEKIIEKGADIHQKCGPEGAEGLSPLYTAVLQIGYANIDNTFYEKKIDPKDYLKGLKIDDGLKHNSRALFDEEVIAHHEAIKKEFSDEELEMLYNIPIEMAQEKLPMYYEVVKVLIKHGADINEKQFRNGFTPFLYSAEIGDIKLFKILVENGANLEDRIDSGASFLHLAIGWGRLDLTNYILDHMDVQPFLNNPEDQYGDYPIHRALKLFSRLTPENSDILYTILDKLLALKPNLNVKNKHGQTPLSIAQDLNNMKLIEKLVQAGAGKKHSSGIILMD